LSYEAKDKADPKFCKARYYAFRLLKFRMRSQQELRRRLMRKKFDAAVIEKVIAFLEGKKFIDDREFAWVWAQEKIKRPLGIARIIRELKIKGIDKNIIEEVLGTIRCGYDEEGIVSELARARLERFKGLEPKKARTRLYAYLSRRGFSPDVISDAIKQTGTEDK